MNNRKQINKVSLAECKDAIDYFWECVDLESNDDRTHYTRILLKKVANCCKIQLDGLPGEEE